MINLFLASSSPTRQLLLKEAAFLFEVLPNACTPEPFNQSASLKHNAQAAATCKAEKIELPYKTPMVPKEIYIITADTLISDVTGEILQKPHNLQHAKEHLTKLSAGPCMVGTACIVQKFVWNTKKGWKIKQKKILYSKSTVEFYVPKESFDEYFNQLPIALYVCGSGIIEGFGAQFLKSIKGSYTAALGLPMFELKKALTDLGYSK